MRKRRTVFTFNWKCPCFRLGMLLPSGVCANDFTANCFQKQIFLQSFASDTMVNPLPDNKRLDWSKFKQIADDILKCKKLPHRVENIVRKGEIVCYKQFLLFSQCFPQLYIIRTSKCGIAW